MRNEVQTTDKGHKNGGAIATIAGETAGKFRCFFREVSFFAAKVPVGCGVHNLVVPHRFAVFIRSSARHVT